MCGKLFTRKAALKVHKDEQRCRITAYDANGIAFERPMHCG